MSPKNKLVFGLVGEMAAGKDTVAAYLKEKYNSETISFSKPWRDILDLLGLPQTRENMAGLGDVMRAQFGQDILSRAICQEINRSPSSMVALPNVRLKEDITYLKDLPGFVLVSVNTDRKLCYQRLIKRDQNPDDKSKTWEQFLKDHELYTEIHILDLAKHAQYHLDNNGTLEQLHDQIEKMLADLRK
ncbi:MAG: hypothetical protein WC516_07620 [Patescibacteria group bacterium]